MRSSNKLNKFIKSNLSGTLQRQKMYSFSWIENSFKIFHLKGAGQISKSKDFLNSTESKKNGKTNFIGYR